MTARLRWAGLAGTVLLAAGGFLAGARTGPAPASQAEALWGDGAGFRIGLAGYLVGLLLLGWAWWRIGVALRAGTGPGLRWTLVTGAVWAAPLLVAPSLGSRDLYAYACQGAVWLDGHDPYAAGVAAGGCPWLAAVPSLWHDTPAPYGPLALLISAGAVGLARAVTGDTGDQLLVTLAGLRVAALVGALLLAGFGPRLARACRVDPAGAAWLGLVTPLVAVHVVAGAHHDALVAGLVVAGLALAAGSTAPVTGNEGAPGRTTALVPGTRAAAVAVAVAGGAGLALGLAVAVKVTAVAALPFAALLAARRGAGDRPGIGPGTWPGIGPGIGVVAGAAAGFAGLTLATGLGTGWTRALAGTGELAQWSSPPTGLGMAAGYLLRALGAPEAYDPAVAVARALGLAVLVLVSVGLLVRAARRVADPRAVVAAAGAVLAAVVLLGPVVYPWYAIGALAVLAASILDRRLQWWLAVATLVLTGLVLPSGLGVPVLTKFPGALLMVALMGWVSWWALRRRWPAPTPTPPGPPGRTPPGPPGPPPGPSGPPPGRRVRAR